MNDVLHEGARVTVKGFPDQVRRVLHVWQHPKDVCWLDREVAGSQQWHLSDLCLVKFEACDGTPTSQAAIREYRSSTVETDGVR